MRRPRTALTFLVFFAILAPACGGQQPLAEQAENAAGGTAPSAPATRTGSTVSSPLPTTTVTIVPSGGAEPVRVEAEIADEDPERERGLMERTSLAEDAGMLFVFGRERQLSFWMKNTPTPLSIAYINADGRIVDIEDMEPYDETSHPSAEPAKYALEANQGFFDERGVGVGDRVEIPAEYR